MRIIATFEQQSHAVLFSDYLVAQGIAAICDEDQQSWNVWVKDEDRVAEARAACASFRDNPKADEFSRSPERAEALRHEELQRRRRAAEQVVNVRSEVFRQTLTRRAPLTSILIMLSIVIALATNLGENANSVFYRRLAFRDPEPRLESQDRTNPDGLRDIRRGEVWRIVTPIFLHFGIAHLVFNLWWLYSLGGLIENRFGRGWLAVIVLASAVAGNVMQFYLGESSNFGGMSGVVYGLFGFLWVRSLIAPMPGMRLMREAVFIMLAVLVLGFLGMLDGAVGGKIANWAHLFGMLAGAAIVFLVPADQGTSNRVRPAA